MLCDSVNDKISYTHTHAGAPAQTSIYTYIKKHRHSFRVKWAEKC